MFSIYLSTYRKTWIVWKNNYINYKSLQYVCAFVLTWVFVTDIYSLDSREHCVHTSYNREKYFLLGGLNLKPTLGQAAEHAQC